MSSFEKVLAWCTFQNLGTLAGIIGMAVAGLTYLRVGTLKKAMSLQSTRRTVSAIFSEIARIPDGKKKLTNSQTNDVEQLLTYLSLFFLSWVPFRQKNAKTLVKKMKKELAGERSAVNIKRDAHVLRDHLFTIGGE